MLDVRKIKSARYFFAFSIIFCLLLSSPLQAKEWWNVQVKDFTITAEVVRSLADQRLGLGNRFFLPNNQGMLFYYNKPGTRIFWMKNMHFPIDIIWLQDGRILHIERDVPPPQKGKADSQLKQYGFGILADMVLEVPAGFSKRHSLAMGQFLQIIQD